MRNGKLIDIDDMNISHLRNTLKLVLRNRETVVKQILKSKRTNFMLHGDMANEFNETHLSDEDDDRFEDSFDDKYSYTRKLKQL